MNLRTRTTALLLASLTLSAAYAQEAQNSPKESDEVVSLSPFMVTTENDTSWTATTTLVGTRTNQELAKVPASIDVITSEFLKDLNLGSLEDAAAYTAGATVVPRLEARNDDGRVSFRGLTASANSRNFFIYNVPVDSYNVDRLDFSKGANSLMFGDSAPGGQATAYTKQPKRTSLTEVFAQYGSRGTERYQIDINRPLTKTIALRFNAVNRVDKSYIKHAFQRQKAMDVSVSWQPFKTTRLVVEGERGKQVRRRGDNTLAISDVAAPGLAFNQNNRWYYTSDGNYLQRTNSGLSVNGGAFTALGTNGTGASGNQVALLSGQQVDVTLPGGVKRTYHGLSRYLNPWGTTDYLDRPYNVFTASMTQGIGKLQLEFAYNQQFQHQDRNDNSFGTTQTPPVISVDANGRPFLDMTGTTQFKVFKTITKSGRMSAAFPVDLGWMKQFFVLTAQKTKNIDNNRRFILANGAGAGTVQSNIITLRAYLDDPRIDSIEYWDQFKTENLPRTATFQPTLIETYANTAPFVDLRYNRNLSLSSAGEYFKGLVNTMVGVSWSRVSRKIPAASNYTLDARGNIVDPGLPDDNPAAYVYDPGYDLGARSSVVGGMLRVFDTANVTLRLYGTYSQSFNWQSGQTFYGQVLGPILGTTREAGIKSEFFGTISFQAAAWETSRQNVAYVWNPDSLSAVQLEDFINPNNVRPGDANYIAVVTSIVGSERRTVNSSEKAKGFDFTLQAKRWKGLQSRATLSLIHINSAPDMSAFKTLLDAAVTRTNAALAPGGDPTQAENATFIANAQTIYNSATLTNKVQGLRSAAYQASFVLDYEIPRVRGLRAGLSGLYVPNYNVAVLNGTAFKAGARAPLSAYAIYDTKFWKRRTQFRVGIQNFYDLAIGSGKYRKTGATGLNAGTSLPNFIYRYADPVTYTASVDLKF